MDIKPIARIKNDFDDKFGIPRQSGRVKTEGRIVFEKEYQNPDYIKGIEQFSHLWLIWEFSENINHKEGADLMNGTPIYDIKPYIPYTDCINDAAGGFAEKHKEHALNVEISENLINRIPTKKQQMLLDILKDDPRPAYHHDNDRIYGFSFSGFEIKFNVKNDTIFVTDII